MAYQKNGHGPPEHTPWTATKPALIAGSLLVVLVWVFSMWMAAKDAPTLDLSGDSVQTPTVEVNTPHSGGGRLVP